MWNNIIQAKDRYLSCSSDIKKSLLPVWYNIILVKEIFMSEEPDKYHWYCNLKTESQDLNCFLVVDLCGIIYLSLRYLLQAIRLITAWWVYHNFFIKYLYVRWKLIYHSLCNLSMHFETSKVQFEHIEDKLLNTVMLKEIKYLTALCLHLDIY